MNRSRVSAAVLRDTARTFALTLRALPPALRPAIETAYLLARAADTVADRGGGAAANKMALIEALADAITAGSAAALQGEARARLASVARTDQLTPGERTLLGSVPELLDDLGRLPPPDRHDATRLLKTLLDTMVREIARFERPGSRGSVADGAELLAYTEGIAGCVGAFWTRVLARHACRWSDARRAALEISGRRYGRGLQLVNILRDIPEDLERGRCHLPADEMQRAGFDAAALAGTGADAAAEEVVERWSARSRRGLLAGVAYASRLAGGGWRVRFATLLPAALGLETLRVMERDPDRLAAGRRPKLSRGAVRRTLFRTALLSLTPRGPRRLGRGNVRHSRA